MVRAIKEMVIIQPGGLIEIRRADLPTGAKAEVIVMVEEKSGAPQTPRQFASFFGSVRNCFGTGKDADSFIRAERDAWSR